MIILISCRMFKKFFFKSPTLHPIFFNVSSFSWAVAIRRGIDLYLILVNFKITNIASRLRAV